MNFFFQIQSESAGNNEKFVIWSGIRIFRALHCLSLYPSSYRVDRNWKRRLSKLRERNIFVSTYATLAHNVVHCFAQKIFRAPKLDKTHFQFPMALYKAAKSDDGSSNSTGDSEFFILVCSVTHFQRVYSILMLFLTKQ
jgi:hypothetical protein